MIRLGKAGRWIGGLTGFAGVTILCIKHSDPGIAFIFLGILLWSIGSWLSVQRGRKGKGRDNRIRIGRTPKRSHDAGDPHKRG